jgi:precorrin-4 methylase
MVAAPDAQLLDSTHLNLNQMVDLMEKEVHRCQSLQ